MRPNAAGDARGGAHLPQLDGLRALAALFVVFHHAWLTVWPFEYGLRPTGAARLTDVFAYGHFAVAVFIVLSGFCLAIAVCRDGALRGGALGFLRRRARRLLPPFYGALLLSLVLIWTVIGSDTGSHWDLSVPVDVWGYVGNLFVLQDVLGGGQVNHVFWSVAVEWQISLLFPLLVVVWLKRGLAVAATLVLSASAVLAFVTVGDPHVGAVALAGLTPQFLALFVVGMLAAHICSAPSGLARRLRGAVPWTALFGALSLGLVAACLALGGIGEVIRNQRWLDVLAGLAAAALLIAVCRPGRSRLGSVLALRPLAYLGTFAFSTYLVHAPLLQLVWQFGLRPGAFSAEATFALLVVLGVPLVVVASRAFFHVCERPFLSTRQRVAAVEATARRPESRQPGPNSATLVES
jgi:peptidoglycan/LPS O-acetylase OafA/YrhL